MAKETLAGFIRKFMKRQPHPYRSAYGAFRKKEPIELKQSERTSRGDERIRG